MNQKASGAREFPRLSEPDWREADDPDAVGRGRVLQSKRSTNHVHPILHGSEAQAFFSARKQGLGVTAAVSGKKNTSCTEFEGTPSLKNEALSSSVGPPGTTKQIEYIYV